VHLTLVENNFDIKFHKYVHFNFMLWKGVLFRLSHDYMNSVFLLYSCCSFKPDIIPQHIQNKMTGCSSYRPLSDVAFLIMLLSQSVILWQCNHTTSHK